MRPLRYIILSIIAIAIQSLNLFLLAQSPSNWKVQPLTIKTTWTDKVDPKSPLSEYPRPQMYRDGKWINLNGLWNYVISQDRISIPNAYSGKILVPFPIESAISGVKKALLPSDVLWYERKFTVEQQQNERTILHFGAVDWKAEVYINDQYVGAHEGGYTEFSFDITSVLKKGINQIMIKVVDPTDTGYNPHGKQSLNPSNIYYTSTSGIWQTVWLETVPEKYISKLNIITDIDKRKVMLEVKADVKEDVEVVVQNNTFKGRTNQRIDIPIKEPRLWSPDDPFLYDITVKLLSNGKSIDVVNSYFGMRKISIEHDSNGIPRIFLNNKYTYNLGALDQGFWPDGLYTAPCDEALSFDIKAIKSLGFNTIRKHIKIEPARWYYHADRLGLLVWQDFVNPNSRLEDSAKMAFENGISETIQQLYNHPSIITWVVFNEKWGQYDQQRMTETVRRLDSTRLVNGHSGELLYVNNQLRSPSLNPYVSSDMADIHTYPYPQMPPALSNKVMVIGEFGGIGVPIVDHLWNDWNVGWGYDGMVTPRGMGILLSKMIDSLVVLEKKGVSASIYTQPYDVESEQNGLFTYDRKLVKLDPMVIREMHSKLLPTSLAVCNVKDLIDYTVVDKDDDFETRLEEFRNGKFDSLSLRALILLAIYHKDEKTKIAAGKSYVAAIKDPLSEFNIRLIKLITTSTKDVGFKILQCNTGKANEVLGKNAAEYTIMDIIYKEEIEPFILDSTINWGTIEDRLISKYGRLGEERIWGFMMYNFYQKKEWVKFGEYYKLYFDRAIPNGRSYYHINNMSWCVFENISDKKILLSAINATEYDLKMYVGNDPNSIDTHANLLYKFGRKKDAIKMEEKAAAIASEKKVFIETLNKMKNGVPTWGNFN